MEDINDPDFVTALARGIAVIRAFDRDHPTMTMADVAGRTGLPRATVRRLLNTLKVLGYVDGDGKHYSLSPTILCLGYAYLSATPLPGLIQPYLDDVSSKTGFSSSASVFNGNEVVYIARSATRRILSVDLGVGSTLPAYCTSMGRVWLASLSTAQLDDYLARIPLNALTPRTVTEPAALRHILEETRIQGWAGVDQELELGLWSIAVPVRSPSGSIVTAINLSLPATQAGDFAATEHLIGILRSTAVRISQALPA